MPESLHTMKLQCGMNIEKSEHQKNACGIKISWISFRTRWILTILRCIYTFIIHWMRKATIMTENEALEYLKKANRQNDMLGILPGSDIGKTLIKALKEVQQYRDTTLSPEQVRTLQTRFLDVSLRLGEYMAIGTPEECREAVTKQISRHPVDKTKPDSGYGNYYENARVIVCPNCNGRLKLKSKGKYCDKCGQKLSWENHDVKK